MQQVCQLSVSEIFKIKHCQAIVSFANEVEVAEEHLGNTFKLENSFMVIPRGIEPLLSGWKPGVLTSRRWDPKDLGYIIITVCIKKNPGYSPGFNFSGQSSPFVLLSILVISRKSLFY